MSASKGIVHQPTRHEAATAWPLLPTETEIYILPDGRVVIADMPAELATLLAQLGKLEGDEIATKGAADDESAPL